MRGLEITTAVGCTLNCVYCPQKRLAKKYFTKIRPHMLTEDTFSECLENVPGDVVICFCGFSEPWMNPKTTAMVKHAHREGHDIRIYTTMQGMSHNDLLEVLSMCPSEFHLHVPDARGNMVVPLTPEYMNMLDTLEHVIDDSTLFVESQGPVIHDLLEWSQRYPTRTRVQNRAGNLPLHYGTEGRAKGKLRCNVVPDERVVWPDWPVMLPSGEVVLCCQDYSLEHILGDLTEQTYDEIIAGPTSELIRQGMEDDRIPQLCRRCAYAKREED